MPNTITLTCIKLSSVPADVKEQNFKLSLVNFPRFNKIIAEHFFSEFTTYIEGDFTITLCKGF